LKSPLITIVVITFNLHCHAQNSLHLTGGSLTENKIIDSLTTYQGTKPQTTYRNRHRIPKTDTIGLYRKQVIERLQTNDSTYGEIQPRKQNKIHPYM
jgi:hypothetical protein